eukprot:PLAT3104.1.p2 GENE.PLAT3104.1~~PLAT3104.1.p2  ORF type:complete len:405 (+),score=135.75 PLAT3104.1:68-1282(+)
MSSRVLSFWDSWPVVMRRSRLPSDAPTLVVLSGLVALDGPFINTLLPHVGGAESVCIAGPERAVDALAEVVPAAVRRLGELRSLVKDGGLESKEDGAHDAALSAGAAAAAARGSGGGSSGASAGHSAGPEEDSDKGEEGDDDGRRQFAAIIHLFALRSELEVHRALVAARQLLLSEGSLFFVEHSRTGGLLGALRELGKHTEVDVSRYMFTATDVTSLLEAEVIQFGTRQLRLPIDLSATLALPTTEPSWYALSRLLQMDTEMIRNAGEGFTTALHSALSEACKACGGAETELVDSVALFNIHARELTLYSPPGEVSRRFPTETDWWDDDHTFVNVGLQKWRRGRRRWRASSALPRPPPPPPVVLEDVVDGMGKHCRRYELPRPVRLENMVALYVEMWEIEPDF